jgi:hypothetical protein
MMIAICCGVSAALLVRLEEALGCVMATARARGMAAVAR